MSNAGAIKGGGVFVEIGADPRKFFATLNKVNKAMGDMGRSLAGAGAKIGGIGVATLAPFAAAVRQGTAYQSTLLNIQASTGATAQELDKLKAASMQMSQAMGVGPTQIAGSFLELLKAGMSVEQVLGGAGQAAIEFATVGQMDVAAAGVVMADAMKVFGVSADTAANAISSAADASSTSIEGMSQAFSQVSAVAALANQSIGDTSAALAILANAGVKGSDAGTSLKTMLLRLMAPADEAVGALQSIGLSVASFRNADGSMKPLVEIIRTLNTAMGGMNQAAKDDIFKNIFGQDAIRAAAILTSTGVDGFNDMTGAMGKALSVGEKFKVMMGGLAGAGGNVLAAMQRAAIAISDAVGPALMEFGKQVVGALNWLTNFARENPKLISSIAQMAVSAIAAGSAFTGLGLSLQAVSFAAGGFLKTGSLLISPLTLSIKAAQSLGTAFTIASVQVGLFASRGIAAVSQFVAEATAKMAMSAARTGAVATNYFAGTISIISATVARAAEGNMRAAAIGVQAMAKLGVSGASSALLAGAQIARLTTTGGTQLVRLGVQGSTALATIGTTATATGTVTVASFAKSMASMAAYAASSIASAGATAMAWAAANVPLLALAGVVGGAILVVSQLSSLFTEVAASVKEGFNKAVADSIVVFTDLKRIATETFSAVSDAMAAGDMQLAMEAAMAGVVAAFARGARALMSGVDGLSADMLNTLDAFATFAANPNLALAMTLGENPAILAKDKTLIDLRARQDARLGKAGANDALRAGKVSDAEAKLKELTDLAAIKRADSDAANVAMDRLNTAANAGDVDLGRQQIAALLERGNLPAGMEQRLVDTYQKQFAAMNRGAEAVAGPKPADLAARAGVDLGQAGLDGQANDLLKSITGARSESDLDDAIGEFQALKKFGRLTGDQQSVLMGALESSLGQLRQQPSQGEVAGTFSSAALGGMGVGGSVAQKQLDEQKETNRILRDKLKDAEVAA